MSGSELLSKQRRYNIGEYKNLNNLTANNVTVDYLNFGIHNSNITITYPNDIIDNEYKLILPNRAGKEGEFLGIDNNSQLKWANPNVIKNMQVKYGNILKNSLITSSYTQSAIIFPSNYEISINPTSVSSKLLIEFRVAYKASVAINTTISFYLYKSVNNVDTLLHKDENIGPLNATGSHIAHYQTSNIIEAGTLDTVTIKLAYSFDKIISVDSSVIDIIGILGYDSNFNNSLIVTDFEGSGVSSSLMSKSQDNESIYYNLGTLFLGNNFNSLNTNNDNSLSLKTEKAVSAPLFIGKVEGNISANSIVTDNIIIKGNLDILGTQKVVNTTSIEIEDNFITLNADGTLFKEAGIAADIGGDIYKFVYDKTDNNWTTKNNNLKTNNLDVSGSVRGNIFIGNGGNLTNLKSDKFYNISKSSENFLFNTWNSISKDWYIESNDSNNTRVDRSLKALNLQYNDDYTEAYAYLTLDTDSNHYWLRMKDADGNIDDKGIRVAKADTTSDKRLKFYEKNIDNGLNIIRQLKPLKYLKIDNFLKEETKEPDLSKVYSYYEAGFVAQDILEISDISFSVTHGDKIDNFGNIIEQPYQLSYDSIFTYTTAAVKELDNIVEKQENKIKSQELLINELISRIEKLENKFYK